MKQLTSQKKTKIIFLPLNRSIADLIILNYINYFFGLEIGPTFASFEDLPKVELMLKYVRFTGVFLSQRTKQFDQSINYTNHALFEDSIHHN